MDAPRVSVVLTTFNRSSLLPRSIESVLDQTFSDFELIVVDDCSSDDTQQVLAGVTDPRLSVVRHERNLGLSEARNTGVRRARGTFVCFHDDDDEWLPNKLAIQLDAFSRETDRDAVLLYSQVIVDDGISSDIRPKRGLRPGEPLCEYLMCGAGLLHPISVMVTRGRIASNPFPSNELSRFEDQIVWLQLEEQSVRFVFVDQPLVIWHVDNTRSRMTRENLSLESAIEWLDEHGTQVHRKARRAFLAREIAPFLGSGHAAVVLRTIGIAVITRAIPISEGLKALAKAFLPPWVAISLRRVFPRSRFG